MTVLRSVVQQLTAVIRHTQATYETGHRISWNYWSFIDWL